MSRNSSVAVLADCTDLYNSHVSLIGLNGPPSVLSIENETILSNNTDISPSQVVNSVSFQERVRSTDLAALFPRGSLNQKLNKLKKKKKKSEISLSASQSSENISSLNSNTNVSLSDENVSASFEDCSENKMGNEEESSKPFNKRLYLKKKSVNISFDSGSLNNSISERSLKRKSRTVNISLDQLNSKRKDTKDTDKNDSLEIEEESAKAFNKRSYLRKKSVNFSIDSCSLNNSVAEKSLEDSQINNVSLQSKRKSVLRSHKFDSVLNIDNLKSGESSEENSTPKKTKSKSKRINISCIGPTSAEGSSFDENISKHDKTIDSLKSIEVDSAKVFNKNLYLKNTSINISFNSSSVNDSTVEKSEVTDVSMDPLSPKIPNVTEYAEITSAPFEGSKKKENEKGPAKVFNKNLYLKKKSLKLSFDSSSLDALTVENILEGKSGVADVSLDLVSGTTNGTETARKISKDSKVSQNSDGTNECSISKNVNAMNGNTSFVENDKEKDNSATENDEVPNLLIIEQLKAAVVQEDETVNEINVSKSLIEQLKTAVVQEDETVNEINVSKSSEICLTVSTPEEEMKSSTKSNMQTNISTADSLKAVDEESAQIFNKNLYLKKKSINLSFDSSSVNDSIVEKYEISNVSLDPLISKITNVTKYSEITSGPLDESQKKEIEEGPAKVFNKNLYLKKKSLKLSFDSSSLDALAVEKTLEGKSGVADVSLDLVSGTTNGTESAKNFLKDSKVSQNSDGTKECSNSKNVNAINIVMIGNASFVEKDKEKNEVPKEDDTSNEINASKSSEICVAVSTPEEKMKSTESNMKTNISTDDSLKAVDEESAQIFNKNLYLKKKSINLSFDSSSLNASTVEKALGSKSTVVDVSLNPTFSKIANVTEPIQCAFDSFDESKQIENEGEPAKLFNKNLYLKKKSINILFDSSSVIDPISEKENTQVSDNSVDPTTSKHMNDTDTKSDEYSSASFEESKKMETEKESAKMFNKNFYLKKKSINISFNSSSINEAMSQKTNEENIEVGEISLNPVSGEIKNLTNSPEDFSDSLEGTQKMETLEESAKTFNKNLYLKKKSINVSFDFSSVNEPISLKAPEENTEVGEGFLDPLSSKITNVTGSAKSISDTLEGSQQTETEKESIQVFNKNLYLKEKSINIPFNSSSINEHISQKAQDGNTAGETSLDPLSSIVKNITEPVESISVKFEGFQKIDSEEESAKIFNKNLYLRKKSINISFNSSSINEPTSQKANEGNIVVGEISLNPVSGEFKNLTHSPEDFSASLEGTKKMETQEESDKAFNKNLYLKKKSINISFDSRTINEPISDNGNTQVDDVSADQLSTKIINVTNLVDGVPAIFEGSQDKETEMESAEICNKKSINVVIDPCSIKELISEKGVEGSIRVSSDQLSSKITTVTESHEGSFAPIKHNIADVSVDPLTSKVTNFIETAGVSDTLEGYQKIETEKGSAEICYKKSINILPDSSSKTEMTSQKAQEVIIEVGEISLNSLSSNIKNVINSPKIISTNLEASSEKENIQVSDVPGSQEIKTEKESDQICYKKKSEVLSANLDGTSENNTQVGDVSRSQDTETENESAEICNMKSINTAIDPCSIQEPISEKAIERNIQVSSGPLSSKISTGISIEGGFASLKGAEEKENTQVDDVSRSQDTETEKESAEVSNKMSINPAIGPCSIHESISEVIERNIQVSSDSFKGTEEKEKQVCGNSEIADVSVDPLTPKIIIATKPPEGDSASFERSRKMETGDESDNNTNNSALRSAFVSKKNLDMRMSVGLSVICQDNEGICENNADKKICHSTPLVKYQKNKITGKKHSSPKEVKPNSKEVFACPDVPSRNLRERRNDSKSLIISKRSRKDSGNSSDNLENSAKKNKSSTSGNATEDFIEDISIIPNPKPLTRSRVMYHSTPITKAFRKESRSRIRVSNNINVDDKNNQLEDKMIQVSKSIFGSSTEVTNATVSKKKSIEFSNNNPNNSSSDNENINCRTKRKSYSQHSGIKKLPKMESISESRSYHSNFISTFEDDTSYCTTRKSIKKVAFKSISSEESSNFGYDNSADIYAPTNRKSVGFRDAISLIEDTVGDSSEGDVRDAVNNDLSIVNPNSIGINDTPVSVNESKTRIDRTDISINYSAEVPEIVLTENEIDCNEMSEECSLFNKLIKMAEIKKQGKRMPPRQNKQSKCKKKFGGSKSVTCHATSDLLRNEKWVSPNLIKFLNNKLMSDALDHVINTDRIVSVLCSVVSAVKNLEDVDDIDFALLPLKNILLKFRICCNMIEYCTFITRFTPFEFQRKALPLEGYFGSCKRGIIKKLTDPILTDNEKMSLFL